MDTEDIANVAMIGKKINEIELIKELEDEEKMRKANQEFPQIPQNKNPKNGHSQNPNQYQNKKIKQHQTHHHSQVQPLEQQQQEQLPPRQVPYDNNVNQAQYVKVGAKNNNIGNSQIQNKNVEKLPQKPIGGKLKAPVQDIGSVDDFQNSDDFEEVPKEETSGLEEGEEEEQEEEEDHRMNI